MQVFIPSVKLLTDSQMRELGLERTGDMALLRRRCQESNKISIVYTLAMAVLHS